MRTFLILLSGVLSIIFVIMVEIGLNYRKSYELLKGRIADRFAFISGVSAITLLLIIAVCF